MRKRFLAYSDIKLNDPIFHYTSVDAFKAIAQSGSIRFSRADQTNDPFELVYIRDEILSQLNEHCEISKFPELWRDILESYERVSNPARFFVSCFSLDPFSVAMWRLYAREGKGIVFSFRPAAFDAMDCRITKVAYIDEGDISAAIVRAVERSIGEESSLVEGIGRKTIALAVRLLEVTVSSKRPHWSYEQEVRLSFSHDEDKYHSIDGLIEDRELFLRMSGYSPEYNVEKGYISQSFGKRREDRIDRKRAFSEILIGPNCEVSEEVISEFLCDCGYEGFLVKRSDVVWR